MSIQHHLIPNTEQDRKSLLEACGVRDVEELLKGVPAALRFKGDLGVGRPQSETEINRRVKALLKDCRDRQGHLSFLGAGVYEHICPAAVSQLTLRGEFLTTYTPYQPEMAQGTLMALFEFQSFISEIFGMDVSNASHYDGSTSLTEAAIMALRVQSDRKRVLVSQGVHPEYLEVMRTYLANYNVELSVVPLGESGQTSMDALKSLLNDDVAAVLVQSPNIMGCVEDQQAISDASHKAGALYVASVIEPLSLGLLNPPGFYGADMATGEGQSFGIPQAFGGPYVGLFTAKNDYVRQMPGRLCGETVDAKGRRSYALTLSTREQHIRREKATSNICSNQNLMVLWSTIWMSFMGKSGFQNLAEQNLAKAEYAKERLAASGKAKLRFPKTPSFNEFVIDIPSGAEALLRKSVARGIAPGIPLSRFFADDATGLLVTVTETKTREDIDALCALVKELG